MAARFQLTETAEDQIGDIVEFIAQDSEEAAVRVRNALYAAFELLASAPGIGHWRPDLTGQPYKFWPVFSYHVMYDPEPTPLKIIAVIHGARDVARLLKEDPS